MVLLLLAACAMPPPPAMPPPIPYPPETRERLARFAIAEWQAWGCLSQGLAGPPLTPGCDTTRPPGRGAESEAANFPAVLAYWRATLESPIPANRARYLATLRGEAAQSWAEPFWSAAFISWLMATAGVDRTEFRPDAAHSLYLDHLDAMATAWPESAPFITHEATARAPAPGDLLCADRSSRPLPAWSARAAERGQFRAMHCDLVVATGPGVIEAIGGNLGDAVTLRRIPADADGLARGFLVVVENRLGRLPPFGTAISRRATPPRPA